MTARLYYILDGHQPVAVDDIELWARWFEAADRKVAVTKANSGMVVSTFFLGLDHSFGQGPPMLFETMTFPDQEYCERCSTWEEAEAQHERVLALYMSGQGRAGRAPD